MKLTQETIETIKALADLMGIGGHDHCHCNPCCDCTTSRTFEQSAARFNESQAFAAAESNKVYLQQQGAQFAQLLKLQADITNKPTS